GLYPAFYLSSLSPKAAFTTMPRARASRFSLRELLVLAQFFVSIAVVTGTLLMALQLQFIANKPLGFEKENRLFFQLRGDAAIAQIPVLRNELLKNPNIVGVAESSF